MVDLPLRLGAREMIEPTKTLPTPVLETVYVDSVSAVPMQKGSAMKKIVPLCAHNEVEPIFESPEVLVTDVLIAKPAQGKVAKSWEPTMLAARKVEELPVVNTFIHFASPKAEGSRARSLSV